MRWVGTHIPRMDYLPLWPLSFVFSSEFSRGERCKCSSIQGVLEAKVFSEQLHDRHRLAPKRYRVYWWTIVLSFPGVTGHREEGLYAPCLERITSPSYWWEWRERSPHWELEGECAHSTRSLNFSQLCLSTGKLGTSKVVIISPTISDALLNALAVWFPLTSSDCTFT